MKPLYKILPPCQALCATVSFFTVIFGVFCRFSPFFIESIQENSYNKHKQTRQKAWQHSLPSAILLCLWQAFCIILAQPAQGFPPAAAPPTAHNKRNAHEKEHEYSSRWLISCGFAYNIALILYPLSSSPAVRFFGTLTTMSSSFLCSISRACGFPDSLGQ